tara:strand:- start:257 stop:592 length:336 start_codon:yes stop_codon:yes gene_type:complete
MPKFYGQNKKRIDPRYFMDEKTEILKEALEDEEQIAQAMNSAQDTEADLKLDVLTPAEEESLRDIYRHLNTASAGGDRSELFQGIMKKLGIEVGGSHVDGDRSDHERFFSN